MGRARTNKRVAKKGEAQRHSLRGWKLLSTIIGFIVAVVGFAAAVIVFFPRIQIDAEGKFDPQSPFPNSVTITNTGYIPLVQISIRVRPSQLVSQSGGKIIGPTKGAGGITTPDWKIAYLATSQKWTIPMGRNVAFLFGPITAGDVSVVVSYWPWLLPKPSFLDWNDEARLITHREPDGQMIWIARPR